MSNDDSISIPKQKRNPDDMELDMTPMIDVTFLLLAFFVVVSKMDPQANVPLPIASTGESIPDKNTVVLIVTLDDTGEGYKLYKGRSMKDETLVAATEPEEQEEEIGEFVENELSLFPTKDAILLKAQGEVTTGTVELVKRGIARSELAESRRIFAAVEDDQ